MTVDQHSFATALLDPEATVPAGLVDPAGRPAGKRFDVYRNNVVVSLIDAMETAFPVVAKLIGRQNFRNLARAFVPRHPPRTPMLMFYGAEFPAFLDDFEPLAHLPYLGDVARLELARRTAYHAADMAALPPDRLAAVPADKLEAARFHFVPALQLVDSRHPIAAIWHFNMTEGAPKPQPLAQTVLVSRPALDVEMDVIDAGTTILLSTLLGGGTLKAALEAASERDTGFDAGAALGLVLQRGLVGEVTA